MIDRNAPFDLGTWYPDIRKIVFNHIKSVPPQEKDDILQEVCLNLLKKQSQNSAFDRAKSAPSHYIIMITKNTLYNRWKRFKKFSAENSLEEMEELGHPPKVGQNPLFDMNVQLDQFEKWIFANDPKIVSIYRMLKAGHTYKDVGKHHGTSTFIIKRDLQQTISNFKKVISPFHRRNGRLIPVVNWG